MISKRSAAGSYFQRAGPATLYHLLLQTEVRSVICVKQHNHLCMWDDTQKPIIHREKVLGDSTIGAEVYLPDNTLPYLA
jgi:hypothetical protein